jgi:4-aminobutyrate aminotransferase
MSNYLPKIITELPGPKAKEIIEKDDKYISPSYTRGYPFVIDRGEGAVVYDVDGNRFLDFNAGIAVCATGHSHPEVVSAIKKQAEKFLHMSGTDFYYTNMVELAETLCASAPGSEEKKVLFCNSGAEAVEAAIKLARYYTNRKRFISFFNSFHGRTMGALSLTGSKYRQKKGFGPFIEGVEHVHYSYCYRCPYNLTYPSCDLYCVHYIEDEIFRTVVPSDEVAAIIVEPLQGEGGYVVPPPDYFKALSELANRHGILIIADEVQSGIGRTGKIWCSEHFNFEPDIVTTAKGLASGLPLGAMIARKEVMSWGPGSHASTFGGNPVACAASLATFKLLREQYLENSKNMGNYILSELNTMKDKFEIIGDIRGIGLMIGIEIVENKEKKTKSKVKRDNIIMDAFHEGLLILGCGENSIRLSPPLTINKEQADYSLQLLNKLFKKQCS